MNNEIAKIDAHIIDDIRTIITRARNKAYQSINETLIRSNWEIGKRIVEEEQLGKQRADYGIQLIKSISQQLTTEFGSGYGVHNLAYFKQLYQYFPDWEILHARVQNLTWTHLKSIFHNSSNCLQSKAEQDIELFQTECVFFFLAAIMIYKSNATNAMRMQIIWVVYFSGSIQISLKKSKRPSTSTGTQNTTTVAIAIRILAPHVLKRNCFRKMKKLPIRQAAATTEVTG